MGGPPTPVMWGSMLWLEWCTCLQCPLSASQRVGNTACGGYVGRLWSHAAKMLLPQSSSRLRLPCLFGVFVVSAVLFVSWACLAVVASAMQVSSGCPGGGSSGVASYLFDCRVYE